MTKETISRYLENGCKGHKNVVSSRELERTLGISGNELRRHINRLRRGTVPIAADQRGYYYAETAAEVYATIRSLEKMRSGLDAAISGLERALEGRGVEVESVRLRRTAIQKTADSWSCFNGKKDAGESDVDCGGECVQGCKEGLKCHRKEDCSTSLSCREGICSSLDPATVIVCLTVAALVVGVIVFL